MQPLLVYLRAVLWPSPGALLFALRTVLAGVLTLYLAFLLDLDQPKWATMTVVIISQPLAGMTLQKSFAQVLGTTLGAAVAVLAVALFPQAPLPCMAFLALWLGLCTAAGTLLRYTRSHAFVLSGFTAVIVALLAQPQLEGTFSLAITRVTETLLGVACVTLVSLFFARPQDVARSYFAQVDLLLRQIAEHASAVIASQVDDTAFRARQSRLLGQISALEGLRRHLYFDAPRLRPLDALVQLLSNQLVLMTSRLAVLQRQRKLILQRLDGPLPASVQRLREDELACLAELAEHGLALPEATRRRIRLLHRRFIAAAERLEQLHDDLPAELRSLAWALRFEQARLMQQLDEMLDLGEAIRDGRPGSCAAHQGQAQGLHLDYRLAASNGLRAFVALFGAGLIWVETAWDGVRAGMILVAILCSMLATFPRPLAACQNFLRGLVLGTLVSAALLFGLLPTVGDFEMLALCLLPLLYVVAIGLGSPQTAGIAIGLGLSTFLLLGPQNQAAWYNSASQWFEFTGGYFFAGGLSLLAFAWIFPFAPDARIQRLFEQSRRELREVLRDAPDEAHRFRYESRLVDRLNTLLGLLPAARDGEQAQARFDCTLACMTLGVIFHQLHRASLEPDALPLPLRQRLGELLAALAESIGSQPPRALNSLLPTLQALSEALETSQSEVDSDAAHLRPLFANGAGLLIAAELLARYQSLLGAPSPLPPDEGLAHAH
ncbi:MAG: p-hydroxybenzoic acid efflux pump subunit AaeB [Stenotrophomonas maltophilia]|nr:MAG: p-hydroxybenzoic acid efflux pump subunit AaeB [Stenotrophomonas maltophilia]